MRISTKGRLAVMAMVDLARNNRDNPMIPVSLSLIAERQDMSSSYLEQLAVPLKSAGLVKSVRGPGGGYLLTKPPEEITLSEVISAVDDRQPRIQIDDPTQASARQVTDLLWQSVDDSILSYLGTVTLADVDSCSFSKTTANGLRTTGDELQKCCASSP